MDENQKKLEAQLVRHEGRFPVLYLDNAKTPKVTGGIGHNFTDNEVSGIPATVGYTLTDDQIDRLFDIDVAHARADLLKLWPWVSAIDVVRFMVLVNMAFNMGAHKLDHFPKMKAAVRAQDYIEAARQMLDSDWARQVGDYSHDSPKGIKHGRAGRAYELAQQMATGEWQEA